MPDTTENPTPTPAPAAKVAVKVAPPIFTPFAGHLPSRPRNLAIKAIEELKPLGNPHPHLVEAVKAALSAQAEFYSDADAIEFRYESSHSIGSQILAQVIPHKY